MRNLIVRNHREYTLPGVNLTSGSDLLNLFAVDCLKGTIYVCSDGIVYQFSTETEALIELFNVKEYYKNEESIPSVVGMCFFQLTDSICLGLSKGDLLSINCSTPGEAECVGFVQSGLRLIESSPDEDVVVLLTCQDSVITMTGSFDPINEVNLHQKDFGENQFISVGWGRKETQFHGSEGKAAALAKPVGQTVQPSKFDDGRYQITWRGDGALFAINCVNAESGDRCVRVFDRKGDLMYTSEHIPGLEGNLSWRPSGNIIASTQRMPNKHVVCFLEKNGLRHGDFPLRFPLESVHIRQLLWNAESTILLAWCQVSESMNPPSGLVAGQSTLLLWTIGNYHWYLKQRIDLCVDRSPVAMCWDQDSGNSLHVICTGGKYINYEFLWRVDHSFGKDGIDGTFVNVIDGDSLLITSFRHSVVPPPMCGTTLQLPAPAMEVVFAPQQFLCSPTKDSENACMNTNAAEDSGFIDQAEVSDFNSNCFCVVLSNGLLVVYSYVGDPHHPHHNPSHTVFGTYQVKWESEDQVLPNDCLHHWTWIGRHFLLCSATVGHVSHLCVFKMDSIDSAGHGHISLWKKIALRSNVISIIMNVDGLSALIQLSEGKVIQYIIESGTVSDLLTLPQPAVKTVACHITSDSGEAENVVLGLSVHNRLYANTNLVMNNVTSIALHKFFLLITTSQQQLFCCPLKKSALSYLSKSSGENDSCWGVVERKVERGSRLVVVVPDGNRVILQMPRGNLECIEPRALSLSQLARLLNTKQYFEAFDLARKQRINLNLFVDHDASLFLQNIDFFVKSISNPHWLCLFLAELQDEDCTTSMYKSHYPHLRSLSLTDKVNTVCDAFLSATKKLSKTDSAKLTLPVLTALVRKQSGAGLEAALALIKTLKESEDSSENVVSWTSALRHLLYLKDVNQLMDAALGMYDFNLVVLVASKSQKDPKEYLAFLNTLRQMEENYQKFSIDKHLRKWESALFHLIQCPDDRSTELLQYVESQGLFKEALCLLQKSDHRFKMIASAYANKLMLQRSYREAGIMFRRAHDYCSALQAHKKALAWRHCIDDAGALELCATDREELLTELSEALQNAGQHAEAATILLNYLQQPAEAVRALCCSHLWTEALRVANNYQQKEMIETVISPTAVEHAESLSAQIRTASDQFNTHKVRLAEVRMKKQIAQENQDAQDRDSDVHGESDLLSDTSSMTGSSLSSKLSSSLSSGSNRSGKNRRKLERKILSLKKGSPHEELALIYALHQNISSTFSLRDEVQTLNYALVDFGLDSVAGDLQTLLSQTLKTMESCFNVIWPASLAPGISGHAVVPTFGPHATSNMLASSLSSVMTNHQDMALLDPLYRFPPVIRTISWEVDILKKKV